MPTATDTVPMMTTSQYAPYFDAYVRLVTETNIINALEQQLSEFHRVLDAIPEEQARVVHPPYGWTIQQVVGHLLDTERIFGYRAMRFATGDKTALPGYDQDTYVANTDYSACSLSDLVKELRLVRRGNLAMYRRLPVDAMGCQGEADGKPISVLAIAYVLVGHARHHLMIITKRLEQA